MTEQPKAFPHIHGRCPACRGDSLFIGTGGWITCSRTDCPNPSAADQMLHGELQIPRPAAAEATEPGDIQLTRKLGHGLIVDHAPPRARLALALLNMPSCGVGVVNGGQISIADQVLYQVTGYDPEHAALLLELVEDWRPAAASDPPKERCDCPPTNAGLDLCPACPGRTKEQPS